MAEVETGRAVFVEGGEALADTMNLVSAGTIPQFTDEAQRDALWPAPPIHALCITQDSGFSTLWVFGRDGLGWQQLIRGLSEVNGGNRAVVSRYLQGRPAGTNFLPGGGLRWDMISGILTRYDGDGGNAVNMIQANPGGLGGTDLDLKPATGACEWTLVGFPDGQSGDMFQGVWNGSLFIRMGSDAANPGRARLNVYGKVYADNVAALEAQVEWLTSRLATLEARLGVTPMAAPEPPPLLDPPPAIDTSEDDPDE